jgi:predicted nucleotidyltransferase
MLKEMELIFAGFGVDFYIVGATARNYHLSASEEATALRKTDDVDLAILLNDAGQFNSIKAKLIESRKFTAHPTEHIKLFYEERIEVNLLPFGKIEASNGMVFLQPPNSFSLSMPGFKEVYPFVEEITSCSTAYSRGFHLLTQILMQFALNRICHYPVSA